MTEAVRASGRTEGDKKKLDQGRQERAGWLDFPLVSDHAESGA